MQALSEELRQIRHLRGQTLRSVESETGISNAYLSQLERGKATRPSPRILARLAEFYEVPYEDLMGVAGYLEANERNGKPVGGLQLIADSNEDTDALSPIQKAIINSKLNEVEEKLVAEYIAFLQSRRNSR